MNQKELKRAGNREETKIKYNKREKKMNGCAKMKRKQ